MSDEHRHEPIGSDWYRCADCGQEQRYVLSPVTGRWRCEYRKPGGPWVGWQAWGRPVGWCDKPERAAAEAVEGEAMDEARSGR